MDTFKMKHIKLFEGFVNEWLSANKKPSKKDGAELMKLAKGTDLDDFMTEFGQVYGSAADIWMGEQDQEKLKKFYASDKYEFLCLGGESTAGEDDSKVHSYINKGWKMFRDEQNYDSYDAILYKKK